jgi:2-polyprenyl-3-methyl-5-hydroxy-6-metoxy-1,4-benzoquinol methylase
LPSKKSVEAPHAAKAAAVSGRDYYEQIYRNELEEEAKWLEYGAVDKVNSVEILLQRQGIKPASVLELGCGTGAVILECQRRGLGAEFTAIDYSKEAIGYLEGHSQGIRCVAADITRPDFKLDQTFDVAILSHVLEHLEEPLQFLQLLMSRVRFRYLVAEVPLEDLLASRLKNLFRDRTRNTAGHVQFFTQDTFRRLLESAGLNWQDHRRYVPVSPLAAVDLVRSRCGLSAAGTMVKKSTGYYLPRMFGPLWERVYYAHLAVLCVPQDR